MSLTTRIEQDYIAAYKAKDALRLGVLRLLKTAAKNLQVELMRPVTDEELASVVQKQAKQRQDSIEQFTAANRPALAEKEAAFPSRFPRKNWLRPSTPPSPRLA